MITSKLYCLKLKLLNAKLCNLLALCLGLIFIQLPASSQQTDVNNLLKDRNGDNVFSMIAFGDSITYGVGDGTAPGEAVAVVPITDGRLGYTSRVERIMNVPVKNSGDPGEELGTRGIRRLASALRAYPADVLLFLQGTNDYFTRESTDIMTIRYQQVVNIARSLGIEPVLMTMPLSCCGHSGVTAYTRYFSNAVRSVSSANTVSKVDLERAWETTCNDVLRCNLLNLPEGLHPNTLGYDVMAQMVIGNLYNLNPLVTGNNTQIETALGLPAGSIVVKPEPATTTKVDYGNMSAVDTAVSSSID